MVKNTKAAAKPAKTPCSPPDGRAFYVWTDILTDVQEGILAWEATQTAALGDIAIGKAKPPLYAGFPGHPQFNPRLAAIADAFERATPAIKVRWTAPLHLAASEVASFFQLATCEPEIGNDPSALRSQLNAWMVKNQSSLEGALSQLSTHVGRLNHTLSAASFNVRTVPRNLPYLCSSTVAAHCRGSSTRATAQTFPVDYLLRTFHLDGGPATSLFEALRDGEPWLDLLGLSPEVLAWLRPSENPSLPPFSVNPLVYAAGYPDLLLVRLPSVAVHDELNHGLHPDVLEREFPDDWVPGKALRLGGRKPENAGSFNLRCNGWQRRLHNRVPAFSPFLLEPSLKAAFGKAWLRTPVATALASLSSDHPAWSQRARATFVSKLGAACAALIVDRITPFKLALDKAGSLLADRLAVFEGYAPYTWAQDPSDPVHARAVAMSYVLLCCEKSENLANHHERRVALTDAISRCLTKAIIE